MHVRQTAEGRGDLTGCAEASARRHQQAHLVCYDQMPQREHQREHQREAEDPAHAQREKQRAAAEELNEATVARDNSHFFLSICSTESILRDIPKMLAFEKDSKILYSLPPPQKELKKHLLLNVYV